MKLPESALAKKIVRNFERDDFNVFIIHGTPRIGKSAYVIKVIIQVLWYLYREEVTEWKQIAPYFGWEPSEVAERWDRITERIPFYVWDDAGYWLHSLNWTDPLLQAIQKYFNVIGTDMNTIILTTPSPEWVLSKINKMPGVIRTKIIKSHGGKSTAPSVMYGRLALSYKPWISPDRKKHGVNKVFKDKFNCLIPDEIYKDYFPIRKHYAQMAKDAIRETLLIQREIQSLGRLKVQSRLRKLRNENAKIEAKLNKELTAKM